jgi:hypothetical protein
MTIRKNISNILVGIAIFLLLLVLFKTKDEVSNPVIVNPTTTERVLPNGQVSQVKVNTLPTKTPMDAGFSKEYVNDTIRKILKVKQKEILALNQIKGTYKDSLQFVRQELDSNKNLIKYYESKDKDGKVIGIAKVSDSSGIKYNANISLNIVIKKGKKADSLIFYDPTQRITINESKEFRYLVKKPSRLKVGISVGVGLVVPVKQLYKPDLSKSNFGYFIGPSINYTF